MAYKGIVSKALALGCSPALAEKTPQLRDLLQSMGESVRAKTVWVKNLKDLADAFEVKVLEFGPRPSRPSKMMAWLCADEADRQEAVQQLRESAKQLPQTLHNFLNVASPVHTQICPGSWTW